MKKALLISGLSLLLCISMLVGATFAWFTDTATTAVNTIQSGNLKVGLQSMSGQSLEGVALKWKAAGEQESILWEPGCTYELEDFQVVNNGNLALRFRIAISGIEGNPKLLEALEFTITHAGVTTTVEGVGLAEHLETFECILLPTGATPTEERELVVTSGRITVSAHMKESAGNVYQGERIDGIAIVVTASQYTFEQDSNGKDYDDPAHAHSYRAVVTPPTCTAEGYTTYTCAFCNDTEIRDYTAALGHNIVDGVCTRCGYVVYRYEGEYVYFGSYPQSKVTDTDLVAALNAETKDANNDVEYDGEKYRLAKNNWYKYEPIKWRVCNRNEETGEAYLLADSILYTMSYYYGSEVGISPNYKNERKVNGETVYATNYQYSDVRRWLTETFYPAAFVDDQQQIVVTKTNALDGEDTGRSCADPVFLPSMGELRDLVYNGTYGNGSNRYLENYSSKSSTAFASVEKGSHNGYWLTRSGIGYFTNDEPLYNVMSVDNSNGDVHGNYKHTTKTVNGVVPAMWVILK